MTAFSSVEGSRRSADGEEVEDPAFLARLQAATDSEPNAVEELVREFQPNLTAYARSRRFPDPDGVVNETLSDGLRNLSTFRGRDRRAFRAYLYQILRRRIVDEYRRAARQPDTVPDFPADVDIRLIDEKSSSFDEVLVAESAVDEILDQLTIEQREVLEMRVLTGLSIKETADLTGRSESAVKAMHRRALRSLRTFLLAAAVVILAVLGVRFLLGLGGGVSIVDNSPATEGDQSLEFDQGLSVPVVEVELGEGDDLEQPSPEDLGEPLDQAEAEAAADVRFMVLGSGVPIASATTQPQEPPADQQAGSAEDKPAADPAPAPASPCSVRTDVRPRPGEIAFVTFNFSGPFEFLESTSADIPGPNEKSALFPGTRAPQSVKDGKTVPMILDGSMFDEDDNLAVTATLANGELSAPCSHSEKVLPMPCSITTGEDPQAGDAANITFNARWPWSQLRRREAHPISPGRTSTMVGHETAPLGEGGPHEFALTENMVSSKRPWVTIAILGPVVEGQQRPHAGRAVCEPPS